MKNYKGSELSKLKDVSKRDFLKVTKQYGLTSAMIALGGLSGAVTLPQLAQATENTYRKRYRQTPLHQLKFGGSGHTELSQRIEKSGCFQFIKDLEERTNGAIRIEFFGANSLCNQGTCVKKTQQGIVDIFLASTQNSAGGAPYFNVLDFPYMFPNRAALYHFFYSKQSEKLLRAPLRKLHKLEFLFSHAELRSLMLGSKWKDKPTVTSVSELAGTKNRVTGTQLGRIAMTLMELNPVPIAWSETLDGLKQGLIDGAETWSSAAAFANMAPVISQDVQLKFFAGTQATSMRSQVFDQLSSDLQNDVMESSYTSQIWVQGHNEAALATMTGATNPQLPGTVYAQNNVRVADLSMAALKEAEEMCSPKYNPKEWEKWRDRLNKMSGGQDVYKEISSVANEVSIDEKAIHILPSRWWKS